MKRLKPSLKPVSDIWLDVKEWDPGSKLVLSLLAFSSLAYIVFLTYFSSRAFFSRDDFTLIVDSFSFLKSIIEPIGSHFRPIGRIHFGFHHLIGFSPFLLNMINVLLHIFTAILLFKVLRNYFSLKVSMFSSLIFFNLYSYNEILFWISAIQLQYCLLFSLLSILFYHRKKYFLTIAFMVLASQSYELWVILPVYFILSQERIRSVIISSISLILLNFVIIRSLGISLGSYGGFSNIQAIPGRISYFFYKQFSPFANPGILTSVIILSTIIVCSLLFYRYFKERSLIPIIFYYVPAILFLTSFYLPSRFFYYPAITISILIALTLESKRLLKLFGILLLFYMIIISGIFNYLDGTDYLNYSLEHKKLIKMGEPLRELEAGDNITLLNCINESFPSKYTGSEKGRPKLLLNRPDGMGGLINLPDYIRFLLHPKGLKAVTVQNGAEFRTIRIGNGYPVSEFSFKVQNR